MIAAARYARTSNIPFLGLTTGMHAMIVEFARDVAGIEGAESAEFCAESQNLVVDCTLDADVSGLRRGTYPCKLVEGTHASEAFGSGLTFERHRHGFEMSARFRRRLRDAGLVASGVSADDEFVDIVEVTGHPWMMGCQFHPEFTSRPDKPHPLFVAFMAAAKEVLLEGAQPSLPIS